MTVFHPNALDASDRTIGAVSVAAPTEVGSLPVGRSRLYRLPRYSDPRGSIVINEAPGGLPFAPKRIFHVFGVPAGELRGDHAHRRCHQFVMAVTGSVKVATTDADARYRVELDAPDLGLHIPPLTWAVQFDFSVGSHVMVLATEPYDRAEYIDDFGEFLQEHALWSGSNGIVASVQSGPDSG